MLLLVFSYADAADVQGARDTGIPRLPGYEICGFDEQENGKAYFLRAVEETVEDVEVSGHILRLRYCAGNKTDLTFEQILAHARQIIEARGGYVTFGNGTSELTGTYRKDGKAVWLSVYGNEKQYGQIVAEASADEAAMSDAPAPAPLPAPAAE